MHNHNSAVRLKHLSHQRSPKELFFGDEIGEVRNSVADNHGKIGNHYAENGVEIYEFDESKEGQEAAVD